MKRRKFLAFITICLLLFTSILTACNDNSVKDKNEPATTMLTDEIVNEEPAEKAQETPTPTTTITPIELTLGIWPEASNTEVIAVYDDYASEFAAVYPKVTVVPAPYSYSDDNIKTMADYKLLPVVFEVYDESVEKVITDGYVADITDILEERGWLDQINPSMKEALSKDGRIYGIPGNSYALGIVVNTALFRKAGIVDEDGLPIYPRTWTELAETGKKIKDSTGAAGFCLLAYDYAAAWQFMNIAWAYGATLLTQNADGSFTSELDTPEAIAAMEYVKALKWDYDILTADPAAEHYGTIFSQLGTGAAAMGIGANDAIEAVVDSGLSADQAGLAPMPAGPEGKQYGLYSGMSYMFAKTATKEQINAALDFITIMGKGPDKDPLQINADVDQRLVKDYIAMTKQAGYLRLDEGRTSLYQELTAVIQAVIKEKNADVTALMKTADENVQNILASY